MSVHNDAINIESSVLSILSQTYKNYEFLILDDRSTDGTKEKLIQLEKKDKRIKLFFNSTNLGLTKSLNILLNHSTTEFIARQDSDDLSLTDRLEKQIKFVKKFNLDGCSTLSYIKNSNQIINKKSSFFKPEYFLKYKNPFIHGTYFLKKNIYDKLNNYDERFYYAQDYKFITELFKRNINFKILKEPLYVLNLTNNISTKYYEEQKQFADLVKENFNK